jgi:hypothetical protein
MSSLSPQKKKIPHKISSDLKQYLSETGRLQKVPVQYQDLLRFTNSINLYDKYGKDNSVDFNDAEKKIKKIKETKINIMYLSYKTNPNKIAFLNCSLPRKINLLGKQMVQSYSFSPRMNASRSKNKQFFNQGNSLISNEGSGDIIEFSIDPVDIGNFNSLMLSNKNKNNVGYNNLASNKFVGNIYDNAAKYYRSYRDIDGNTSVTGLAMDIARLDLNYQSQTNLKGSIRAWI